MTFEEKGDKNGAFSTSFVGVHQIKTGKDRFKKKKKKAKSDYGEKRQKKG